MTAIFAGTFVITGSSISVTVTVKLAVSSFPWISVAVYVTVVSPTGKLAPGKWFEVNVSISQLSVASGAVQVTIAAQVPASELTAMFVGTFVISGSSVSVTVTLKLAVSSFPWISVAV